MFIPLFGGMLLGMFVDTGRSVYQLCILLGVAAQAFYWVTETAPDAVLLTADFFLGCLGNVALAMLSAFLIRWQLSRSD